jgi:hypothetical protein
MVLQYGRDNPFAACFYDMFVHIELHREDMTRHGGNTLVVGANRLVMIFIRKEK